MKPYSELLKDPRWQKVRLRKLESAEWKCERCYDSETMLSVHHKRYLKGRMPWEYDEQELAVLCQPCHEVEHEQKSVRDALIARLDPDGPRSASEFFAIACGAIFGDWDYPDAVRNALVQQIREESPYQFAAGELIAKLVDAVNPRIGDMHRLVSALDDASNDELRRDFISLMDKHEIGIKFSKSRFDPNA